MDINRHLQRKFLIVVDGTPESHAALRFAARRAHGTGGKVALLLVIEPETHDHWLGVSTLMKEEAEIEAEKILTESAALVEMLGGEKPESHIRHGQLAEEIARLIDEDRSISTLVLAAAVGAAALVHWSRPLARVNRQCIFRSLLCRAIYPMMRLTG